MNAVIPHQNDELRISSPNDTKSVQYLTNGLVGNLVLISKECPLL